MAVTIHHGPYTSIPPAATPGLQFLKDFLPALDSLDPHIHPVAPFLHPEANIFMGSNPPSKGKQVIPLLEVRRKHLSAFHHDMNTAWDIAPEGDPDSTKRTVMFEATSATLFRNDADQFVVRVEEFNILELEAKPPGPGQGQHGELQLQVVEMRTYLDPRPVQDRAARLHMSSAYGRPRRQADPRDLC